MLRSGQNLKDNAKGGEEQAREEISKKLSELMTNLTSLGAVNTKLGLTTPPPDLDPPLETDTPHIRL